MEKGNLGTWNRRIRRITEKRQWQIEVFPRPRVHDSPKAFDNLEARERNLMVWGNSAEVALGRHDKGI